MSALTFEWLSAKVHDSAFQQIVVHQSASFHPQVSHFHLSQQNEAGFLVADLTVKIMRVR
jgi:hypothetical protein